MPLNNYLNAVEVEKRSLAERLRGRDEVVRESGAYSPTRFRLISIKHAFVQIVGPCVFVYIAVVPGWGTQSVTTLSFGKRA